MHFVAWQHKQEPLLERAGPSHSGGNVSMDFGLLILGSVYVSLGFCIINRRATRKEKGIDHAGVR